MSGIVVWLRDGYWATLRRYAVFRGRSRREELWAFTIVAALLSLAAAGLDRLVGSTGAGFAGFRLAVKLIHVVPYLALLVRRLHDLDRDGWWMFWPPAWSALYRVRGTPGANRFGPFESRKGAVLHEASASDEHRADQFARDGAGADAEAVIDTVNGLLGRLGFVNWFVPFWFGLVISFFGALMLSAGIATAPNTNWWIAIAIGIAALGTGLTLLRYARTLYVGRRNRPSG